MNKEQAGGEADIECVYFKHVGGKHSAVAASVLKTGPIFQAGTSRAAAEPFQVCACMATFYPCRQRRSLGPARGGPGLLPVVTCPGLCFQYNQNLIQF